MASAGQRNVDAIARQTPRRVRAATASNLLGRSDREHARDGRCAPSLLLQSLPRSPGTLGTLGDY
jgi:hypothetical protein